MRIAERRESISWRIAGAVMVDWGFVAVAGLGGSGVLAALGRGNGGDADAGRGIGGGAFSLPATRRMAAWRFIC